MTAQRYPNYHDVPLWAVMGGFHLSGEKIEEVFPDIVKDIQTFGIKRIVPAHCTGGARCTLWPTSTGKMCWCLRQWEGRLRGATAGRNVSLQGKYLH